MIFLLLALRGVRRAAGPVARLSKLCHPQPAWHVPLHGTWAAGARAGGTGNGGTVPAAQRAPVALGGKVAVLGAGLSLPVLPAVFNGKPLSGATLAAPTATAIMSVRAWPGVITGLCWAGRQNSRTEVVIDAAIG